MTMTDTFEALLEFVRHEVPAVRGAGSNNWVGPAARTQIRQSLAQSLPELSSADQTSAADLQAPPRLEHWSSSIAHTHDFGGWMAVPRTRQIGWDVELRRRIQPRIVERVSRAAEIEASPDPGFLWCAKEAFFKALEDFQPVTMTELTIANWQARGPAVWRFHGLGPHNAKGHLLATETHLMAAVIVVPD